jgi:hypothetical protein
MAARGKFEAPDAGSKEEDSPQRTRRKSEGKMVREKAG